MCAIITAGITVVSRTVRDSPAKGFPDEDGISMRMSSFPNLAMGMQVFNDVGHCELCEGVGNHIVGWKDDRLSYLLRRKRVGKSESCCMISRGCMQL
jgi:hypothetical protein